MEGIQFIPEHSSDITAGIAHLVSKNDKRKLYIYRNDAERKNGLLVVRLYTFWLL